MEKIKTLAIIGAGQMGRGILIESVLADMNVIFADKTKDLAKIGKEMALKEILDLDARGRRKANLIPEILKERFEKIYLVDSSDLIHNEAPPVDFAIEAITEDLDLKLKLFNKMDENFPEHTILASNTSTIPISKLGEVVRKPDKVIGMHFMNPVPLMSLVEIITTPKTSEDTYKTSVSLAKKFGKTCVTSRDFAGFIVNRILFGLIPQAFRVWEEKIATAEDIDQAMRLGCNHPMGPLALADLIGLDTCLNILNVLEEHYGSIYTPPQSLKKLVEEGKLGRKTKKGVYLY